MLAAGFVLDGPDVVRAINAADRLPLLADELQLASGAQGEIVIVEAAELPLEMLLALRYASQWIALGDEGDLDPRGDRGLGVSGELQLIGTGRESGRLTLGREVIEYSPAFVA